MEKERNVALDGLKGAGILFMILGHMAVPQKVRGFIFSFHMPLFFFVSGYLYKEKSIATMVKSNAKKVLFPYFITGLIIWISKVLFEGNYEWGLSIFLGNGSYPVWHFTDYYVGPLWFLACYFVSLIGLHYLFKVKESYRFPILMVLWIIAFLYKHFFNLLPFDILNSIPAISCLYIGYLTKRKNYIKKALEPIFLCIGILILSQVKVIKKIYNIV